MWNYRKNDYAANKYSPNIVYRFNDEIIEISLEDYLEENPDRTEQDFLKKSMKIEQKALEPLSSRAFRII